MSEETDLIIKILPFLIPLIIVQIALLVIALVDLIKRERVRGGNKIVWGLIIVFFSIIGPAVYLLAGRLESDLGSD